MNLFHDIRLTERMKVQVRAEAFNIASHVHFSTPSANVSNMSLNADGMVESLAGFS